jgi:transcriptional regulator with XRE-family HTH domain
LKTLGYNDVLAEELRDAAFRREYEALAGELAVAKEIIRLRKAKGWTQKELAERAHTSQPAIARLESGTYRNVTLSFLRRVGEALDVVPVVSMQGVSNGSAQHACGRSTACRRGPWRRPAPGRSPRVEAKTTQHDPQTSLR